jgi:hypothetical protein
MNRGTRVAILPGLLALTLFAAGCGDSVAPAPRGPRAPQLSHGDVHMTWPGVADLAGFRVEVCDKNGSPGTGFDTF